MLHALTYSIINHIKTQVPEFTEVVWVHDGVSLTDRVKPFGIIEQMPESNTLLSAGRQDYEQTFRFQIGVFARNISERSRLSDTVKSILSQPNIPFLDTRVFPSPEIGVFVCDVIAVTPIPVEDISSETNTHRVYLDVEVVAYRRNGDGLTFTQ
jgi:hypothetical protein